MAINEWPVNERDKAYSEAGPHSIQGLYRLGNAAAILRIERSTGGLDDSVAVADNDVDAVAKTSPQCDELARLKKRKADALGSFFERLDEMECELAASPAPQQQTGIKSYIVVVEGLDGSGKSSLVEQLSQRLHEKYSHAGAKVVAWATPTASLSAVRPVFDKRGGPVARAFYMVSNYMLQYELQQLEKRQQLLLSQEDIGPDSKTSTSPPRRSIIGSRNRSMVHKHGGLFSVMEEYGGRDGIGRRPRVLYISLAGRLKAAGYTMPVAGG
jgi:predicted ATPase